MEKSRQAIYTAKYQSEHRKKGLCLRCPENTAVRVIFQNDEPKEATPLGSCWTHIGYIRTAGKKWREANYVSKRLLKRLRNQARSAHQRVEALMDALNSARVFTHGEYDRKGENVTIRIDKRAYLNFMDKYKALGL
jgi:hypothetical protein